MKNDEKRGVSKRTVAILLALVLVIGCAVGGTLAWLTAKTQEVKNTFSPSNIDITLTETWNTDSDKDGKNDSWSAKLVPGYSYKKDPVVTVQKGSEDCYLFVQFEEKNNPRTYLDYTSLLTTEKGWTQGTGTGEGKNGVPENVWYRVVHANDTDRSWNLLAGDKTNQDFKDGYVTVKTTVTKETLAGLNAGTVEKPELVYTAYASQYMKNNTQNFSPADAWANIGNPGGTATPQPTTGTSTADATTNP